MTDEKTLSEELLSRCVVTERSQHLVRQMLRRIGDKWSISTIIVLAEGTRRFTEVQQAIPGISHRMLTVTLRSLEGDGLVARTDFGGMPRRVEYALTPLGVTLIEPLLVLIGWAEDHYDEIEASRSSSAD